MIIAVDAAGGDYAPHEIVKGALKASEEYDVEIALVGKKDILHVLAGKSVKKSKVSIIDAPDVIETDEHPMRAVLSKPNSSIVIGINLVKNGTAAAFVSAGNTGAVFGAAFLSLGKIENIDRPAIGCVVDITPTTPAVLVDAGANVDCKPQYLLQFAHMGSIFSERVLGIKSPRVGLLSNGKEENKGDRLVLETFPLLRESGLNFIGNIEGDDVSKGKVDVIVCDGFVGNIVLKTLEGLGDTMQLLVKHFGQASYLRGRELLNMVGMHSLAKKMDFREYGGACFLGVNGNVIKAHGRSQAKAIKNAIGLAKQTADGNVAQIIKEGRK